MRIALFSECYTPVANGVVTSMETLRVTLRAWGHQVCVFAPGAPQREDDGDIYRLPELPFPSHPYHFARPFPRLKVDFASLGIDLVHCQHPFTIGRLGADTARKHGLPMIYTAHSLYDAMATYSRSPLVRTVGKEAARGVVRRFCARADCVICPSQETRNALRRAGVKARFSVVPSGVLGPYIRPGARERLRAELGLAENTPLALYVGRLGPEKRVDILLHAVRELEQNARLPAECADFQAIIVGDGQCRADLEALNIELNLQKRVRFVGTQPHATIGDWYAAADIFALPSPEETQGVVLVEAMAAGLPCVAMDYGGPREVVVEGKTGYRTPLDPIRYAAALETLLRDPDQRCWMGRNGRVRARAYSPEAMARGVLAVYEEALRSPRLPVSSSRALSGIF